MIDKIELGLMWGGFDVVERFDFVLNSDFFVLMIDDL